MERPTCETCPYWHCLGTDDGRASVDLSGENSGIGECHRFPPYAIPHLGLRPTEMSRSNPSAFGSFTEGNDHSGYAVTFFSEFCGEHPDFPAYVASLKGPKPAETG